jgi:nucleotide-binding universal stress UspA family protein
MQPQFILAKQEFQRARQRARMQELAAQLTGKSVDLLVYDEVRRRLNAVEGATHERKNIPLAAIIGSVGRYSDFNRQFLPLRDGDGERWARVKVVMEDLSGLPPIDVYQVGEAYFVVDGNHRVSIARQLGTTEIEAYVRTVQTRVPFPADASQEDLILLSEYAYFLEQTRLDEIRPQANLRLTAAGQYDFILQQIEVQHFLMELRLEKEIPYAQAVSHWYDDLYLPIVKMIRARKLLKDFPTRTEGDFFVWLLDHQARLTKEMGWQVRMDAALIDLTEKVYAEAESLAARVRNTVLNVLPLIRSSMPPAGQWREGHRHRPGRMFGEIMVPLTGATLLGQPPWPALTCALEIAQHEHAQVYAVHLSPRKIDLETQANVQKQLKTLCEETGTEGSVVFEKGKADVILPARSRWVDLIIASLERDSPTRAGDGAILPTFRPLIQRCHTPILVLPGPFTFPTRALLAYDCSKKADEALFMAAYLSSFWGLELVIYSVIPFENGHPLPSALAYAEEYLKNYQIKATFCHGHGEVAPGILRATSTHACDLILIGGYGEIPLFGGFRRRTVDAVVTGTQVPVLICR